MFGNLDECAQEALLDRKPRTLVAAATIFPKLYQVAPWHLPLVAGRDFRTSLSLRTCQRQPKWLRL
eukprot:SAG31_NODE_2971_length_4839_cov_1.617722_8_plen_66_part_00